MTDEQLLAWAKANPNDARASKIFAHLGGSVGAPVSNPALGPPDTGKGVAGGPQDPETGLDQRQLAETQTPGDAKAGGMVLGGLMGGVSGALPGFASAGAGALTTMLNGYLGRKGAPGGAQPYGLGDVSRDAAVGGIPLLATKGVGQAAVAGAMPKLAGYGLGQTTEDAAMAGGPSLSRVPDNAMKFMSRQQTPGGATALAGMLSKQGNEAAGASMAAGANPPSRMIDAASQMGSYAAPTKASSLVRGYLGGMFSPVHSSFGVGPSASTTEEARYLSMMAQAARRGVPLTPEMQQALKSAPGQTTFPSAVGAASGAYPGNR